MNAKYFKLVPCTEKEIKSNPQQAFVSVWNLRTAGFIVSPETKIIIPDWTRHIMEGSAAIFNTDNLIQQVMKAEEERQSLLQTISFQP